VLTDAMAEPRSTPLNVQSPGSEAAAAQHGGPSTSPPPRSPQAGTAQAAQPAGFADNAPLEADDNQETEDDGDSALGDGDGASDTASLLSSVLKFREENGRTYHSYKASSDYFLPNDEHENDRLDLHHNIIIMMQDNKLCLSPIGKAKPLNRVLDAGCGTGIWSMEFADEHPETKITGVDLSPIQPEYVAPNIEFFVDDLEEEWNYTTPFDFVYLRAMSGSIRDWDKLFTQAYNNLVPGGYIEICDLINPVLCDDGTLPADCPLVQWNNHLLEATIKIGSPLNSALSYKERLAKAGFVNIVQKEFKWPINGWPKDQKLKILGEWVYADALNALQAFSLALFTKVLGWSVIEIEVLLAGVRKDLRDRSKHGYWPSYTIYAQKPE